MTRTALTLAALLVATSANATIVEIQKNSWGCKTPAPVHAFIRFAKDKDREATTRVLTEAFNTGECQDLPAGQLMFVMDVEPPYLQCLRAKGETSCLWSLPGTTVQP